MCTAVSYKTKDHYFGRNLDYEFSYQETVTVTPRNYAFPFNYVSDIETHYAMVGMAYVASGYPLYYDATNENGLSMAGLNFVGNAVYHPYRADRNNIAPYEFIPWILSQCENIGQAKELLQNTSLILHDFSPELPATQLHWMICDKQDSIIVEPMDDGIRVYDDPVGVLTNNPPFEYQLFNLNNYMHLSCCEPENSFSTAVELKKYSRGMGGIGLPGDLSSQSRYVRAAFTKLNSISGDSESESISQFFHILGSVSQQRGCVRLEDGYEITIYSSCCNTDKGIYYYKTYENSQISAVNMYHEDLNSKKLKSYPLITGQKVNYQN